MAEVKVTPDKLVLNGGKTLSAGKALDAADGAYIDYTGKDSNIILLLTGSAEDTVTIEMGDGIQGVADETVSVPGSGTVAVVLESGRFKKVSGQYKGYVHLKGAATTKVQAFESPV